ncbi:hypothetical protein SUDANB58_02371 [Streptomyces sp. enrichment culture]
MALPVAATAALLLTFGAAGAYLTGPARPGGTLARQGAMPRRTTAKAVGAAGVPRGGGPRGLRVLVAARP